MKREAIIASLDIGASIKKLRESRGLSQDELAKDICDRTTITKLENGSSKIPSFIFILQICDKLNVTLDEFINIALSNSYSLDKNFLFNHLLNNNIDNISEYLSNIDMESLSNKAVATTAPRGREMCPHTAPFSARIISMLPPPTSIKNAVCFPVKSSAAR